MCAPACGVGGDAALGEWDAVLTCFFIDTAQNIVSYIETIATLLREGGVWINIGPLLFHFEVSCIGRHAASANSSAFARPSFTRMHRFATASWAVPGNGRPIIRTELGGCPRGDCILWIGGCPPRRQHLLCLHVE